MKAFFCKVVCKLVIGIWLLVIWPAAVAKNGQAELDAFVSDFVVAVSNQDTEWLDSNVDINLLMEKVANRSNVEAFKSKSFRKGFSRALKNRFSLSITADLKNNGGYATYLKYIRFDGGKRPIIRLDYADGMMNYLIPEIVKDGADQYRFSDVFYASTGQYFSQTMSDVAILSIESGTGFLDKLRGKKRFNDELTKVFAEVGEHRLAGNYQKAYDALMTLPDELKYEDVILTVSFGLAGSLSEKLYQKELNKLIEHSSSKENKEFLLIDYYFYREEYQKAVEVIDLFEEKYVEDGAINLLRSNLHYLDGDLESAIWSAVRCNALEPAYEDCYWNLVAFYAEAKRFEDVAEQLAILESDFGYVFDIELMKSEPIYSEFIKSNAYQEWINN